jgi:RNA-binding protein 16
MHTILVSLTNKLLCLVCSTTLWVGHLSKLVQQEELSDTFGKYGEIVSIDMIPPRGCAFIVMDRRQDAFKVIIIYRNNFQTCK